MDPSSSYLVCSYSNKSICIYDFVNGGMITQAMGHSEVITGVVFLPDCKHVISVSSCCAAMPLLSSVANNFKLSFMFHFLNDILICSRWVEKVAFLSGNYLLISLHRC